MVTKDDIGKKVIIRDPISNMWNGRSASLVDVDYGAKRAWIKPWESPYEFDVNVYDVRVVDTD